MAHPDAPTQLPAPVAGQRHRDGFVEEGLCQNDGRFVPKALRLPRRRL